MVDLYHTPLVYLRTHTWPVGMSDEDAISKIKKRAEQNEPLFMILLSMYMGKGCVKDFKKAKEWLSKGLTHDNADAFCLAGVAYLYGYYGERDSEKALECFDAAEKIDLIKGRYCKGYLYFNRYLKNRLDKDSYERAGYFLRGAAMAGHATSLVMYIYCASEKTVIRYLKLSSALLFFSVRRIGLSGPQRWWGYRDLMLLRPASVEFAENCGHALGYYEKN